jgi:hypothetical protein
MLAMPNKETAHRVERAHKILEFCKGEGMSIQEMCEACNAILASSSILNIKRMSDDANKEVKGDVSNGN